MRCRRLSSVWNCVWASIGSTPRPCNIAVTGLENLLSPAATLKLASSSSEKSPKSFAETRAWHSCTTILKADTSSNPPTSFSHNVSALTWPMSNRASEEGVTLIAEVFVSKSCLVWGVGLESANGCDNSPRTVASERNRSTMGCGVVEPSMVSWMTEKTVFQEL